jgi:hypothetical protein
VQRVHEGNHFRCLGLRPVRLVGGTDSCLTGRRRVQKEICDGAVAACMQANLSVNPLASTPSEKKTYCDQFFGGCMTRSITANFAWYSPETVQRFLKCPS